MQKSIVKMNKSGEIVISLDQKFDRTYLIERMVQLLPILEASAKSDEALTATEDQRCDNRLRAVLAIEMMYSAALANAEKAAEKIGEVASGALLASQIGFPEFDDDADEGYAD